MDEQEVEVNYVFIVRKAPLLLAGAIFFAGLAIRCYEAWASLDPVEEREET